MRPGFARTVDSRMKWRIPLFAQKMPPSGLSFPLSTKDLFYLTGNMWSIAWDQTSLATFQAASFHTA